MRPQIGNNLRRMVLPILVVASCTSWAVAQPDDPAKPALMQQAVDGFLAEKITLEQGWERHLLSKEILLYAIGSEAVLEKGRGFWNPGQDTYRWTGLLLDKNPEILQELNKLEKGVQVRIALTLLSRSDQRGEALLQKIIDEMPREKPDMAVLNAAIYRLSRYYIARREFDKATKTSLLIQEFTASPDTLANLLLSAARATYAAGDKEGAAKLYQQIVGYGYGWATGHAYNDQARHLFNEGKIEEGRALLQKEIFGSNADQIRVVLDNTLAESYFSTGEWEQARQYAMASVTHYAALAKPIKNHGLEQLVESAKAMPERIAMWQETPVHFYPDKISLKVVNGPEPVRTYFTVDSYRKIQVEVVSNTPSVKPFSLTPPQDDYGTDSQMIGLEIQADKEFETEFTVKIKEFPKQKFAIKVEIRKDETPTGE